jgi:hypothetical protein
MAAGVQTPTEDVATSGVIGDMIEAVKRGAVGLRDEAERAIDRMRDAYARAQARRMLYLALFVGLAYLLLRGRR